MRSRNSVTRALTYLIGTGVVVGSLIVAVSDSIASADNTGAAGANAAPPSQVSDAGTSSAEVAIMNGPPNQAKCGSDQLCLYQATLDADFPSNFGGIYANADQTLSVVEVGSNPTFEAEAQNLKSELPPEVLPSSASSNPIQFVAGSRPLNSLYSTQQSIMSAVNPTIDAATPGALQGVWGTGIDTSANKIIVYSTVPGTGPDAQATSDASEVAVQYGDAVEFSVRPVPVTESQPRQTDSTPWAGGDQIMAKSGSSTFGCTAGFNIYFTASGASGNLFAGHCLADAGVTSKWYNNAYPTYNPASSRLLGTGCCDVTNVDDSGVLFYGGYYDGLWQGSLTGPVLKVLDGWNDPLVGNPVCNEGSFTGQSCGTVSAVNVNWSPYDSYLNKYEHLQNGFDNSGAITAGDSGGPALFENEVLGQYAAGILISTDGKGGSMSEQINEMLTLWSLDFGQQVQILDVNN